MTLLLCRQLLPFSITQNNHFKACKHAEFLDTFDTLIIILIIMVIFKCYFSEEHIALSIKNNNNGVNRFIDVLWKLHCIYKHEKDIYIA